MDKNRRRFIRKVPGDPAFIQIERDEVGKVLNVSEGGLSFRSVTPVPKNLPVYFWFSFNLKDRIEAMGEVAWTDLSRTVGGLRFTQISQAGREQIQKWLSRLRTEEAPREVPEDIEAFAEKEIATQEEALIPQLVNAAAAAPKRTNGSAPAAVPLKTIERKTGEPDRVSKFVSKARAYRPLLSFDVKTAEDSKAAPPTALEIELPKARANRPMFSLETGAAPVAEPPDAKFSSLSFRGIESLVELVPLQRYLSAKKRQLLCGVILGICMSAAVTLPAFKFWSSHAHADTKPTVADSLKNTNTATQPPFTPPNVAPQAKPNYPVAGVFSDPMPAKSIPLPKNLATAKGTTAVLSARNAPMEFYRQDAPKTLAAKTTKQTAGTPGQAQSSNPSATDNTSKKSGMTPNQLWVAVQAGDSKAALELAELYIKGDGVPQNCQQARVLLLVASERRNTAAIKRLQQLDKGTACP
jgi:hypothetical protein